MYFMNSPLFENPYRNIYGVTGILGSGKTTCSEILKNLGCTVLFADKIAHLVLSPFYLQYDEIVSQLKQAFEQKALIETKQPIINKDNTVNRKVLGHIVFKDKERVNTLNNIVHPHIKNELTRQLLKIEKNKINTAPIIYDIPLLFENNYQKFFKKTILVYTSKEIATQRFSNRTGLSINQAQERLKYQISIEKKKKLADYLVDNQKDFLNLENETTKLYKIIIEQEERR